LDIRFLVDKAFPDFAQYRNHNTETHWKDLVLAMLEEQVLAPKYTRGPAAMRKTLKANEQQIAREALMAYSTKGAVHDKQPPSPQRLLQQCVTSLAARRLSMATPS
jgi:hypothetical protein